MKKSRTHVSTGHHLLAAVFFLLLVVFMFVHVVVGVVGPVIARLFRFTPVLAVLVALRLRTAPLRRSACLRVHRS